MNAFILFALGVLWLFSVFLLRWRENRKSIPPQLSADLLAGGVLFLLVFGFFWRTLSGDVYQPADGGDLVSFLFPTYRFAAATLANGSLPLWNPHLYGGAPFIGDIQAGFLYPPNVILFLLWPQFEYQAMQWLSISHLYWAGLGMYVLVRTLRLGGRAIIRPAALFAGLAFAFSDPLLIHFGNLNLIAVLSWLPWVLAAYHRALDQRSLRWAALAGALFALANLAGHAQSSLYIGLALALYTCFFWLTGEAGWQRGATRARMLVVATPLTTLLVALLLSAPILLPALELSSFTTRSEFTYQDTVGYSLSPAQMIGLITPGFFGRGPALHWSLWQRVELPYAGVATLILAIAGLLLVDGEQRRRLWPWIGLALFGLTVGLGIYAIVHGWLTVLLPGFDLLRAPARALVIWTLAVSVLAAVGLDRLAQEPLPATDAGQAALSGVLRWGGLILLGVVLPLSFLALLITQADETAFLRASVSAIALAFAASFWLAAWALIAARQVRWLSATLFAVLLAALLFFDLSATGAYTDISPNPPTSGYQHPEIIAFLQADADHFRIDTRTGIEGLWQPDTAALVGLEDVGGIANPLELRSWHDYWEATGGRDTPRYDLLNAKYVIVRDATPLPGDKFVLALDAPGDLAVYRNTTFAPRAWLALPATDIAALAPDAAAQPVVVDVLGTNRIVARSQTAAPSYLVFSDVWYPGWQATIDGAPADVVQANGLFRAVMLPAGESTVELRFAPSTWRWGVLAAGIGLLLALVIVAINPKN
jgi:hypothetical protein